MKKFFALRKDKPLFSDDRLLLQSLPVFFFNHIFFLQIVILIFFSALSESSAFSGQKRLIDADSQFSFAGMNYDNHEYEQAIQEYKRFIYFFPDHVRKADAFYMIGLSLFQLKRYETAIDSFNKSIDASKDESLTAKAFFMISETMLQLGSRINATASLEYLIDISSDKTIIDRAHYRMGWIHIDAGEWHHAISSFENVSEEKRTEYRTEALIDEIEKSGSIPRKSPAIAGILAVIPGGGYTYCHRYQDALAAFLINGAGMIAAYEAFDNEMYALGTIISIIEIGFFSGNIYGSISAAEKYNQSQKNDFIDRLKRTGSGEKTGRMINKTFYFTLNYRF